MEQIDKKTTREPEPLNPAENPNSTPGTNQPTETNGCLYLLVTAVAFWGTVYFLAATIL